MLYQAHRGVSTDFPENTMPAFIGAWEQGYQYIELDPAFTADNGCVVFHDRVINRTCRRDDGSAFEEKIASTALTLDEIKALDAGMFKGEQFRGVRIPTLAETLETLKPTGVDVKLDNVFQGFNEEQFEIFCETVKAADKKKKMLIFINK